MEVGGVEEQHSSPFFPHHPYPFPVYVCNAFYSWPLLKPLTQILYCHKSFSCHPLQIVTNIGMLYE